ncbi:MAG: glycosyltransferase family 4 protein, partial [Henriciella sp.]|uniref:glycosyltransferase family 4 protein n=1 Tax=Henriciella sp. TaxID=1968823 RepID=UPI003C72F0AF
PCLEVALLTWEYPPIPTAKGRVASETAHALAAHGANVRVFTMDRDDTVSTDHEKIEVIGCAGRVTGLRRLIRCVPGLNHIATSAAFRERVQEEHERRRFDVIETTNWRAPASMLMNCGLPVVVRSTAPDAMDAPSATRGQRLSACVARGLEARSARKAAAIISNSRSNAAFIKDWYDLRPGQVHMVTPMSVNPEIRKAGQSIPFPPAHARLRLAYIGGDDARKGFGEMLQAFAKVVRHYESMSEPLPELHLIGLEPDVLDSYTHRFGLSETVMEQILDFGRLTDLSMSHVIARCHGVLAPSRFQSTGSVYREAAAFGRPLLACAEDPTAMEFVQNYACGRLVENCTPDQIAASIVSMFGDRDALLEMRRNGLDAAGRWTRDELGARTFQIYRRAMNLAPISIWPVREYVGEVRSGHARRS